MKNTSKSTYKILDIFFFKKNNQQILILTNMTTRNRIEAFC